MKRVLIACATILAGSMGGYATEAPAFSDINIINNVMSPITVSGKILDPSDKPLAGATILVKGTTSGTVSGVNGDFQIQAEEGSTLIISYIGYQTVEVAAANTVNVTMEEGQPLEQVIVSSTRAGIKTPMAYNNISQEQIQRQNYGKDIPFLLATTPSITTTSDAGNGVGYTSIRVRGTDPSRINITANGIPINDAESAQVYWVNMSDFASSTKSLQIQRGVGTSTNGSGAFGATLNMQTESVGDKAYAQLDASAGSYGTHKETVRFSSGLLKDHWGVQGRLSNIHSDGYLDRARADLQSYFVQAGYFANKTV
ncbi:MAG: carboxypeptidase-like regulatory domain-containing protein, partial [Bacteroidales bacterium]|nr:carboxypeptidase-like regulatory domain-containing protein [Bacteroidales bacterium]